MGLTYDASFLQIYQGIFLYDFIFMVMMAFYLAGNGFIVKVRLPRQWLYLAGLFILSHLMTIIVSFLIGYPNLDIEMITFVKFIYLFSLMLFASMAVKDEKLINDALLYFAVGSVAAAALGFYQVVNASGGHLLAGYYYRIAHHDASLLNANTLTIQTSISGAIVLMFLLKEKSGLKKWGVYLPTYLFLMGVTFFTFSKGGWTGFAVGTLSTLMLNAKRIGALRLTVSSIAFAVIVYLAFANIQFLEKIPEAVAHRLSEGQMTGSLQRIDYFENVFRLLFMEPPIVLLTGVGFKNYIYMFHEKRQFLAPGDNSHNLLSYLIFGTGFSGAIFVLVLFASMFWIAFKCRRVLGKLGRSEGTGTFTVNMFISWLFISIWFSLVSAYPIFHHTFWIFTGIAGRYMYDVLKRKNSLGNSSSITAGTRVGRMDIYP